MRFPLWARNDKTLRLKFLCLVMSSHAHRDGTMRQLCLKAKINCETALKAQTSGRMTYRVATALAEAAAGSGVKAIWLMAPEMIDLDKNGEVVE